VRQVDRDPQHGGTDGQRGGSGLLRLHGRASRDLPTRARDTE
jgi:hypothetical protein